jgi:O-antigen/teichoic acid export membrane protein
MVDLPASMQKKFLSNLAFLLFLNLLVKPFWIFGIDRAVQNEVGAEAYGSYFALFNFALILNIFLDLGISNFNNRNISQHEHLLGKYFPRIVALRLLLAVGYFLICIVAGLLFNYSADQLSMLALLCFNQFLLSFILFLRSNISGLQLFKIDSTISILDRLLMIVSCGWILWFTDRSVPFQIEWFVYLQTGAYSLTMLAAFGVVLKYGGKFSYSWNFPMLRLILKQSLPFALLILFMSIYGRVDSVLIERLLIDGKEQAGIYAQAFRLLDASNMIAYLFAVLLLPMFSRMLKLKEDVGPLAGIASKLVVIPAFALGLICYYHGSDLMELMYHEHSSESAKILAILMFSLIPMAGVYVIGTLLTANGSLKMLNTIALITVIISIGLNMLMIPLYGVMGAAITCLATQGLSFILQLVVGFREFNFRFGKGAILLLISLSGVWTTAFLLPPMSWMTSAVMIAVSGAVFTGVSLLPDMQTIVNLKLRR